MKMYSAASDPESPSNKAKRFPLGKVWPDLAGKKRVCRRSVNGAMFETVEGAAVVCYGISQAYKESTNCRLEAQYAFQQQAHMVPLMLEDGYRPKGWIGMHSGCGCGTGSTARCWRARWRSTERWTSCVASLGSEGKPEINVSING